MSIVAAADGREGPGAGIETRHSFLSAQQCAGDVQACEQLVFDGMEYLIPQDQEVRAAVHTLLADGIMRSGRRIECKLSDLPPSKVRAVLKAGELDGTLSWVPGPRRAHMYRLVAETT